ncbi:MAG: dicarboxylate/amino acid:cation symporter [Chlamydiales bacterium]|nr:dicarboxylate/amino acid:cation symporter [Chlamydiales bacterium]
MKRSLGSLLLFFSILLGLLTGWVDIPALTSTAHVVSELFLRLLKLISLPLIFLAITSTISGMKSFSEIRKMGKKVLFYTLGTTLVAATTALILYVTLNPAASAHIVDQNFILPDLPQNSYLSFVMNIIPSNIAQVFVEGNVIGIVFLALFLSSGILLLPKEKKDFLHNLFSSLFSALLKMTGYVIKLMPIAIWAFMALLVKDLGQHNGHLHSLMLYLACVVGANLIQGLIILPLILKMKGISPVRVFKGMWPALSVAFFSKSSGAALPVTMQSIEENVGVSKKISSFSLPLCSVVNMNACAAFILTTVLFVSTLYGMTFTPMQLIMWIFFATLAAIGNAGVPMGCFFLTSAFLVGMNVPLYMMGVILPFYTLIDMLETALNVWSDAVVTTSIDKDMKKAELADESVAG